MDAFGSRSDDISPDEIKKIIRHDLTLLARESKLKSYEVPKRIGLLAAPFTIENGCLTTTQKTRREVVRTNYRDSLRNLYSPAA